MKIKNFTKIFLFVAVAALFSCSGSDDGASGDGGGGSGSSLTISVNSATIFVGESVTFTVVNNLGANLTSTSDLKIGSTAITNPYTFDTAGSFNVIATNGTLTGSTTITVQEIPVPSAITLTVDKDAFWYDIDSATFTVMDDIGNDVTGLVTFSSDSDALTNPASFAAPGTYNATATFTLEDNSTLTSNTLVLTAVESTHTTKVMIEDYTGTWCQYCPRVAYAVEQAVAANVNIIPVAVHREYNGDPGYPMHFPSVISMLSTFGVDGYPEGRLNRTTNWNESVSQPVSLLSDRQNMGLAINSSLSGTTITAEVKVHYDLKADSQNRIVVYLLEDGLVYPQVNFYNGDPASPYYQQGNPIVDFVHDNTARITFTDVYGDNMPNANTETGATHIANYSITVPSNVENTANLELVAFVVGPDNTVLNVQKAELGENKDFD